MKIKLHIVLFCCNGVKRPRFEKTIDYEITQENFADFISRKMSVLIGDSQIPVVIEFNERDWNKRENTLHAQSQMRDSECKAYLRNLEQNGWDEIPH